MNPEVKEKWLAALRSGDYTQGQDVLWHKNKFCCLGVLCDIHAKETNNLHQWEKVYCYFGHDIDLPDEVTKWAGLKDRNPLIPVEVIKKVESAFLILEKPSYRTVEKIDLATINDNCIPFNEIADLIEEAL